MKSRIRLNKPEEAKIYFENKLAFTTGPVEVDLCRKQGESFNFIDVRDKADYELEHAEGAINFPRDHWADTHFVEQIIQKDKLNILYCYTSTCHLAATAAVKLAKHGFSVVEMEGGFEAWKENDLPIEKGPHLASKTAA